MHGQVRIWHMSDELLALCPTDHPWILAHRHMMVQFGPDSPPPILPAWREWIDVVPGAVFRMQETSGTVVHEHVGSFDATLHGAYTLGVPGPLGGSQPSTAIRFAGGHADAGSDPENPFGASDIISYTDIIWFRTTSGADQTMFFLGSGDPATLVCHLHIVGGSVHFDTWQGGMSTGSGLNDGAWHFVMAGRTVGVFGSLGSLSLFIDGTGTTAPEGGYSYSDATVNEARLGCNLTGGNTFIGDLAEAAHIFDFAPRPQDAAAWYAVGRGLAPSHANYRGVSDYGRWVPPQSRSVAEPTGEFFYLQNDYNVHTGPFVDASGRLWFLGYLDKRIDYPAPADNHRYWHARWDSTSRRLVPVFYVGNPSGVVVSSQNYMYGGIISVCDDGHGGLYILTRTALDGEQDNATVICRWDGVGETADSTLPAPTPTYQLPGRYWLFEQYLVRTAPYSPQTLWPGGTIHPPAPGDLRDHGTHVIKGLLRVGGQVFALTSFVASWYSGVIRFGGAVIHSNSLDAADPNGYATDVMFSSSGLGATDAQPPDNPSGPFWDWNGTGSVPSIVNHAGYGFWSNGMGYNTVYTASWVPSDMTVVRIIRNPSIAISNSFVLPPLSSGNTTWCGSLVELGSELYLFTGTANWTNDTSYYPTDTIRIHLWRWTGYPSSWVEVDHYDSIMSDPAWNHGTGSMVGALGFGGIIYAVFGVAWPDTYLGDAPRYNQILSWDSSLSGTDPARWKICEWTVLDTVGQTGFGGMWVE